MYMRIVEPNAGGAARVHQKWQAPHGAHALPATVSHRMYLFISPSKSTPPQNRQLVVYYDGLKD